MVGIFWILQSEKLKSKQNVSESVKQTICFQLTSKRNRNIKIKKKIKLNFKSRLKRVLILSLCAQNCAVARRYKLRVI